MIRLISIQQSINKTAEKPIGEMIRCTLLADNTTDELPKETDQIEDAIDGQKIAPGSCAITTQGDLSIMGNSGEWGEWI